MNEQTKKDIIDALNNYIAAKGLSLNQAAKKSSINSGYLSCMCRMQFTTKVKDVYVPIGDKWFVKAAEFCGYKLQKQYWQNLSTRQLATGMNVLESCAKTNKAAMLIGSTGMGKSKLIELFVKKHPVHTYLITISSLYKLNDVINELAEKLSVDFNNGNRNSQKMKVELIIKKLIDLKQTTNSIPLIIIDEAENTKMPVLNMLKALYDAIIPYCSIVLIGTEQLIHKLQKLRRNSMDAVPQFARRFKAGTTILPELNKAKDFTPFYNLHNLEDGIRKLLNRLADNYGELHDYLEPALRQADAQGERLTEELFRLMYNIQN